MQTWTPRIYHNFLLRWCFAVASQTINNILKDRNVWQEAGELTGVGFQMSVVILIN